MLIPSVARLWVGLLLRLLVVVVLVESALSHTKSCQEITDCEDAFGVGSECIDMVCTNPFYRGGCLYNMLPDWKKLRVCTSEDTPDGAERGVCRDDEFDHLEIRIYSQNWESVFLEAWILQILLSEILGVPTTIETGEADKHLEFWAPDMPLHYGTSNDWDALRTANGVEDCRTVRNQIPYRPCAHVIPEVWNPRLKQLKQLELGEGVIGPPLGLGAFGQQSWFIPRFTGRRDPTLLHFLGLAGEENRRKLADTFLRPTNWTTYCEEVSETSCYAPDGVAVRAPRNEEEGGRMFVDGLYTGHFRKTEKNDCDKHPTTCTGHIADYPCDWASFVLPLTHHLNIALESDGEDAVGGYNHSQLIEIWSAANATKSNVIGQWWHPELMYQSYVGTDVEMQKVSLTPPTQDCIEARIDVENRCTADLDEQVGDPVGACGETPHLLKKVMTSSFFRDFADDFLQEAQRSPAYEAVRAFQITDLQVGKIFDHWHAAGGDRSSGFHPRHATCQWVVDNFHLLNTFVPRDYPRAIRSYESGAKEPLYYLAVSLAVIALITVTLTCVTTYRQRKRRIIRFAQVEFLGLTLAGLFLVALGSVLVMVPPTTPICTAAVWFSNYGYTLELVPLIIKVAAINKLISAAQRMKRVVLKREMLFGTVFAISVLVGVVLILWTVLDQPRTQTEYLLTDIVSTDGDRMVTTQNYCRSDSNVWRYVSVGWQTVLLLSASVLAFQTRHIREDMNESLSLAIMVYSHFVFVLLRVVIFVIEDSLSKAMLEQVLSVIYSTDVIATIMIYFVPKFCSSDPQHGRPSLVSLPEGHRQSPITSHLSTGTLNPSNSPFDSGDRATGAGNGQSWLSKSLRNVSLGNAANYIATTMATVEGMHLRRPSYAVVVDHRSAELSTDERSEEKVNDEHDEDEENSESHVTDNRDGGNGVAIATSSSTSSGHQDPEQQLGPQLGLRCRHCGKQVDSMAESDPTVAGRFS